MVWRTTFHNHISTPIPNDVNPKTIISLLHDHDFLITMSPIVTRHAERDREGGKINYDVWEDIDLLPFGLWKPEIKFSASFNDTDTGVTSWIEAPLGLLSEADYTVRLGSAAGPANENADGGEGGVWILNEDIESSCSILFKPFVEGQMVPVRKKMHLSIIEKARELDGTSDPGKSSQNPTPEDQSQASS